MRRPKGSKNKNSINSAQVRQQVSNEAPRKRGRPKGSKNRTPDQIAQTLAPVVVKIEGKIVSPVHTYTHEQIAHQEAVSGLKYAGSFTTEQGEGVPILLKDTHSEEEAKAIVARIRKGI